MKKNAKVVLTEAQVRHIANLAKLTLTAEEVKKIQEQLSAVLEYVSILSEVETTDVTATNQVTNLTNVSREDEISSSLPQKEALANAAKSHRGFFEIEAILEE